MATLAQLTSKESTELTTRNAITGETEKVLLSIDAEDAEEQVEDLPQEYQPVYVSELFSSAAESWTQDDEMGTRMRKIAFFPLLSMFVKVVCCLLLFWVKTCTGLDAIFTGLAVSTSVYALVSAISLAIVYKRVGADRMPYGSYSKAFQVIMYSACASYVFVLVTKKLFVDGELYYALFQNSNLARGLPVFRGHTTKLPHKCDVAAYVSLTVSVTHCATVVYDICDVIFPLLWTKVALGEFVFF
ncbi:hypothetical protein [Cacatuid alphaherpesvirus 2]|uniref:Envelope protein UL20 n=1 Tax=Cacatuid alphaherpesvirus 2 TaxID=2604840 RepID=A0A5B9R026_9ALPH|nr:hypothetical protein QKT46_gp45 [Cacatuid alphaherpesvirus 2]QEG54098.1 hypothetical protein [Cacatuid alphaherpesvirus 2]